MKTKTKEELIDELKQETSIGCVLYLKGHTGDFPEDIEHLKSNYKKIEELEAKDKERRMAERAKLPWWRKIFG